MSDPTASASSHVRAADGPIAYDVLCVRCAYNLRMLQPDGICPECGTAIWRSLHGRLLSYADPDWVARLAKGATWTVRGINCMLLALIVVLVGAIAIAVTASSAAPAMAVAIGSSVVVGAIGLLLFGAVLLLIGYWWLTLPDPGVPDEDQDQRARRMGRIGLLGAFVAGVMTGPLMRIGPYGLVLAAGCWISTAGLLVVGCWGFFGYLARLCERIPDANLTTRSRSVRKGLVICFGLYLVIPLLNMLLLSVIVPGGTRPRGAGMVTMAPDCVGGLIFLFLLVYLDRALRLLTAFRAHLRAVLDEARRNWEDAGGPAASRE